MMKMLLVSNMYPSKKAPNYGVFVKNTEQLLRGAGIDVETIVLRKQFHKSTKLLRYTAYYMKIIALPFLRHYDLVYVHYAAQNAWPVLFLKKLKKNLAVVVNVHGSDVVPETARQETFQPAVRKLMKKQPTKLSPRRITLNGLLLINIRWPPVKSLCFRQAASIAAFSTRLTMVIRKTAALTASNQAWIISVTSAGSTRAKGGRFLSRLSPS
ncbi:glycosyltransferase [Terrilactibacillus sp. S3-3]|nr:glycosyltransferase [Terrilactibacillus sp. S3-3]